MHQLCTALRTHGAVKRCSSAHADLSTFAGMVMGCGLHVASGLELPAAMRKARHACLVVL
jgi:hypothetical protein